MLLHPPPILKEYLSIHDIFYIQKQIAQHFRREFSFPYFQSKWKKTMSLNIGLHEESHSAELFNKPKP